MSKNPKTVTVRILVEKPVHHGDFEILSTNYKKIWFAEIMAAVAFKYLCRKFSFPPNALYRVSIRLEGNKVHYRADYLG